MGGEIRQADLALSERKEAIASGQQQRPEHPQNIAEISVDTITALLSGFDLDPDELINGFNGAGLKGLEYLASIRGAGPAASFGLMWLDGLAVGLLIARAREREATGA